MDTLLPLAKRVGEKLKARKETVGVSESSSGGLISPPPSVRALITLFFTSVRIEYGGQAAWLINAFDITERKQSETVIRQANETLKKYADDLEDRTDQLLLAAKVSRAARSVCGKLPSA